MKSIKVQLVLLLTILISVTMAHAQNKIYLTVNGKTRTATLCDNTATEALMSLLERGSFTVHLTDYDNFEKFGALPEALPANDSQITTEPGDIMLYQGDKIVIFYGSNSWAYTRIGKIDDATAANVKDFLGAGNVDVTVSASNSSSIGEIAADSEMNDTVYDLNGCPVVGRPLAPGIYIINGQKVLIK